MWRSTCLVALLLVLFAGTTRGETRLIAVTGHEAPSAVEGAVFDFDRLSQPRLQAAMSDASGQVFFLFKLAAPGLTAEDDEGLWMVEAGGPRLVAHEGRLPTGLPPGDPGESSFRLLAPFSQGVAIETSKPSDPADAPKTIWKATREGLTKIVGLGDPAPGTSRSFSAGFLPDFAPNEYFAFRAILQNEPRNSDVGIWAARGGGLELIALEGGAFLAHGERPVGPLDAPLINSAGNIVFGRRSEPFSAERPDSLWTDLSGNLAPLVTAGDRIPHGNGVQFATFSGVNLTESGTVTFSATLSGEGVHAFNDQSIWTYGDDGLQLIAREDGSFSMDDTPDVFRWAQLGDPIPNDAGQTAFFATIRGKGIDSSNDEGIWLASGDTFSSLAREGDEAPGTPPGVRFASVAALQFNDAGNFAFSARLRGPGVTEESDGGIWFRREGVTSLVAREGDSLDVEGSGLHTIGQSGLHFDWLDANGGVLFSARFTDERTGIFQWTPPSLDDAPLADFDGDGDVDGDDLLNLLLNFGASSPARLTDGDANRDGSIDRADVAIWRKQVHSGPPDVSAARPVPEPKTLFAMLAGLVLLLLSRLIRPSASRG